MMHRLPLLIELGTEELPPKSLDELGAAFRDGMLAGLTKRGIGYEATGVRGLWSPRRLAVIVDAVDTMQPDQSQERRGPAVSAGFDAKAQATPALRGFAQSCGVEVEALERLETDKGAWFVHRSIKAGASTASLLPQIVDEALKTLPIPKPMRWGDREVQFVRPAHWLVLLLGDAIVDATVLGLKSDRFSRGHRFHHPKPVWIGTANDYVESLRGAQVLVDPQERRATVLAGVQAAAAGIGGTARVRDALLDEVKNLVEWPVAIACTFEREFLRVPQEALITTMENNQKFFPVLSADGKLTEAFIGVANIVSSDPAEIRKGYERVIRPRFADAAFFFDDDLKTPLASHQEALKRVTYQQKLGSVWDKCCRVAELARVIAGRVGVDAALATHAAALSKCDLMTRMVGEFPELQGVMGRYYATAQGENAEVAAALDEFYMPRFAGDGIATRKIGQVLSLAERLDTLAGLFAIGQKPSGNKDPFSLRRNALGLARTIIEGGIDLELDAQILEAIDLAEHAVAKVELHRGELALHTAVKKGFEATAQGRGEAAANEQLYDFILERLRGYYADQGIRGDMFDAVASLRPSNLLDLDQRLRAVVEFSKLPAAQSLAAANKRIGNILRQAGEKGERIGHEIVSNSIESGAEAELEHAINVALTEVGPLIASRRYVDAFKRLALLREPVDAFFDGVMVMVEDPIKRSNRLVMLNRLRRTFLAIADISGLQAG